MLLQYEHNPHPLFFYHFRQEMGQKILTQVGPGLFLLESDWVGLGLMMGPSQKFLTQVRLGQFFVA